MTNTIDTPSDAPASLPPVLAVYEEHPMHDGDAVLLVLESQVAVELAELADHWQPQLADTLFEALRGASGPVVLAVARPGRTPRASDTAMWRDLHDRTRRSALELLPLHALPAA